MKWTNESPDKIQEQYSGFARSNPNAQPKRVVDNTESTSKKGKSSLDWNRKFIPRSYHDPAFGEYSRELRI